MLLGNVAQQLYNTVDSIVVGKYVGDNALAAVGSAGPILNLIIVLFIGVSMGASIMVSQFFGARDREALSWTVGNCILLTIISSAIVTGFGLIVTRPLLELLNTPAEIIDWCTSYLWILFAGSTGMAFFNIISGVLRGLGDAISALLYLVVSTFLNIVLDIVFVANFGLGVNGVALATVIAQSISAILCVRRLMKMKDTELRNSSKLELKVQATKIILPLTIPALSAHGVLWFIAAWNDYLAPTLFIKNPSWHPVTVMIAKFNEQYAINNHVPRIMAGSVMLIVPVLIIYGFFQRWIIESMMFAEVKE